MEGLLGGLVKDKDPRAEIVRAELDAMAREAEMTGLKLRRSKAYEEINHVSARSWIGSLDYTFKLSILTILYIFMVLGNGRFFVIIIKRTKWN